ncbi:OB-fold protein [Helicobacter cappadocius]|uniref:tRNA_anti-like n=1 Tax=Helicobacter cappadocius TaxID=3063998 RepID=A0AA90Q147_9HELI|nr:MULTISPECIES: hypothetical protein [unclassified Helicobacter]MDO7252346.1 hypothetical protein [Helicobacter sp. faydin-H75]MDP2538213.1 hypothetical protein [Helicobacter sp. faydin-H76]
MRIYIVSIFLFLSLGNFLAASNSNSKIFKTTPDELDQMFSENELFANEKLDGKSVEITGVIASIGKSMGKPYVEFKLSNSFLVAVMFVEISEINSLTNLRKGQTTSLICEKISYFMFPTGENCTIKRSK